MKHHKLLLCVLIFSIVSSVTEAEKTSDCENVGGCLNEKNECVVKCDCNNTGALIMTYNETLGGCVINYKLMLQNLGQKYNLQDQIREEMDRVFQGIIMSATIFITCAGFGLIVACAYCCRIGYMDNKLKKDVDALANKLNRDGRFKKTIKSKPNPTSESCNIIVEDAGVYVV